MSVPAAIYKLCEGRFTHIFANPRPGVVEPGANLRNSLIHISVGLARTKDLTVGHRLCIKMHQMGREFAASVCRELRPFLIDRDGFEDLPDAEYRHKREYNVMRDHPTDQNRRNSKHGEHYAGDAPEGRACKFREHETKRSAHDPTVRSWARAHLISPLHKKGALKSLSCAKPPAPE